MTMKMINSTSMTSTIGVTLMLELTLAPSFLTAIAILVLRQIGSFAWRKSHDSQSWMDSDPAPAYRLILASKEGYRLLCLMK
jgi:hypothetical protein